MEKNKRMKRPYMSERYTVLYLVIYNTTGIKGQLQNEEKILFKQRKRRGKTNNTKKPLCYRINKSLERLESTILRKQD